MTHFFRKKGGKNRHISKTPRKSYKDWRTENQEKIIQLAMQRRRERKPIKFESYTFDINENKFVKDKKPPKVIKNADRKTTPAERVGERTQKPHHYKDPFKNAGPVRVIDQQKICKERKEKRKEIMKKTKGKGMSIKKAEWTIESRVRCN